MGYSFDMRGRICCDWCGTSGGVRKRTCPHMVSDETGHALPYCPAPALCAACYKKFGPSKVLHADCKVGAEAAQRDYDNARKRLADGDWQVRAAYGTWHDKVPDHMTMIMVRNREGTERHYLIPADEYDYGKKRWLSDYPNALLTTP
jgi:hypothetical protein